jgi:hypothetical protein
VASIVLKGRRLCLSADIRFGAGEPELIQNNGLAFDHAKIAAYALRRLRSKLEYTDVAFNLMPERFTLSELQQVYEVILGRKLLAPVFRRKIVDRVKKTNLLTDNAGHRPSVLFERG